MTENGLSILSVIFSVQLQQTEISERKLFIFHLGLELAQLSMSHCAHSCIISQFFVNESFAR